jgi:hypothetical protein
MGAGRADEFDDETTDLGSVSGRSSGPVEAAERVHRLQSDNQQRQQLADLHNNLFLAKF